ncbi:MAG: hypothetical protein ACODAE_01240, partial [Gemmatimonadota bacterium]
DRRWALEVAGRSLRAVRGRPRIGGAAVDLVVVDDDADGPAPPSREPFARALRGAGIEVEERAPEALDAARPALIAVYADIRAWKGRSGLGEGSRNAVRAVLARRPDAPIVLFGHARLAGELPGEHVLVAWGGEALMQEAAALRLASNAATAEDS